ncbi:MAG TPA: elongation factor Ts [Methylophaga aminisulfidivorans]|jgi:elongation factor Ts|uniref:Elongation factor Ts n=2 Tax=Methylophaga TaxID=40222 RepID=F5SUU5_9GAMM|nr:MULTISPECIES: translation elongation factor Ts [Methylophaga]EGL56028.1 translation elongation factor Ts [Methylophaga aminisulfidivorans MP]WVI86123.1 translation elongation factor Ts [Methylophaga thalassica]GLP98291.1 elongation factor Ts [Methylophaga thalassica]HIC47931.1 elongation factor Ts [Methylophaga sp.]HIM40876.1 elongation factor Ts [Methylophaga aminisulfidivorans]
MAITAALVKELRERTGSGMMECKKALVEANGDIEVAIEEMRKSGLAKADKKADRITAEGIIGIEVSADNKHAVMVEVNSETDFVAKADDFVNFVSAVAKKALEAQPADLDALKQLTLDSGDTVETVRQALVAKIGENIQVRRFTSLNTDDGIIGFYRHGDRIGTMVQLKGGNEELAKDLAMHVAANRPQAISPDELSQELLDKERDIVATQARDSGKPENIIEKMIEGRMAKFVNEISLVGQPFVKDPDVTVEKLIKQAGASIEAFEFFEVGEGIEKAEDNFAEEVMAQARGK